MKLNLSKIDNITVAGVDTKDYPNFCDSYVESADYKSRPMTEKQLDELNNNHNFSTAKTTASVLLNNLTVKEKYIGKIVTIYYNGYTGFLKPNYPRFDYKNYDKGNQ